jgi:hypothetical protein
MNGSRPRRSANSWCGSFGSGTVRRVYVVYGPPDEIESHPVEGFDKWRYHDLPGLGKSFDFTFRTKK